MHTSVACRFKSVVAEIDEGNVPDYIRQYTDAHRVHMFDIIMQFRAIFYDGGDSAASTDATSDVATGAAPGKAPADGGGGGSGEGARAPVSPVLASWAHQCMETFVDRLDTLLPSCAPSSTKPCMSPPVRSPCMHVLIQLREPAWVGGEVSLPVRTSLVLYSWVPLD